MVFKQLFVPLPSFCEAWIFFACPVTKKGECVAKTKRVDVLKTGKYVRNVASIAINTNMLNLIINYACYANPGRRLGRCGTTVNGPLAVSKYGVLVVLWLCLLVTMTGSFIDNYYELLCS